jgi:hypothetical protein
MRRAVGVVLGVLLGLSPLPVAGSGWGSPGYGDPPGWCTNFSDMWVARVVTNDPHVGTNPERNTFYGFHANPGYDDWYGYFYGDFRGSPGDASGWVKLLHENYPDHYHWNFADKGWAVHGHAKQYIAYYNWTFGGQCALGSYGDENPPPFMADQYGYPVVDIYVDSIPPNPPQPVVTDLTTSSVSFSWDPVADRGDGAGKDFFEAGMDHYSSWLTLNGSAGRLQRGVGRLPRTLTQVGISQSDTACVHVVAFDKLQNASPERVACAGPLGPPPMPVWVALNSRVVANPAARGLVGLDSWFWLDPQPGTLTAHERHRGIDYGVMAVPNGVEWDFSDGGGDSYLDPAGFGRAYPEPSTVRHVYEAHSQAGYAVKASVRFDVTWTALVHNRQVGPYSLGSISLGALPIQYPVEQAQPELIELGGQVADQPEMRSTSTTTTGPAGLVVR